MKFLLTIAGNVRARMKLVAAPPFACESIAPKRNYKENDESQFTIRFSLQNPVEKYCEKYPETMGNYYKLQLRLSSVRDTVTAGDMKLA